MDKQNKKSVLEKGGYIFLGFNLAGGFILSGVEEFAKYFPNNDLFIWSFIFLEALFILIISLFFKKRLPYLFVGVLSGIIVILFFLGFSWAINPY